VRRNFIVQQETDGVIAVIQERVLGSLKDRIELAIQDHYGVLAVEIIEFNDNEHSLTFKVKIVHAAGTFLIPFTGELIAIY